MKHAMESVNPDLKFEIELEEDFPEGKLPTLDTAIWLDRQVGAPPRLRFEFYEKPMSNKFCMLERSAMAESSKIASLSQDVVRRMLNTDQEIPQDRRNEIVDDFVRKLSRSGYKKTQVREIIISGLKCYMRKVRNAEKVGQGVHRSASSTLEGRKRKKILAKTNWYKSKKKSEEGPATSTRGKGKQKAEKISPGEREIRSLLFVPRTKGGELAKRLRREEEKISEMTGYKIKIVERSGGQVRRILCSKNPWAGSHCQREKCMVCNQEGGGGECKRRSVVYMTTCTTCKKKGEGGEEGNEKVREKGGASYIGETGKSGFERGINHQDDHRRLQLDSHILKHQVLQHGEGERVEFTMKIVKKFQSAFKRQVYEAVKIEMLEGKGEDLLNSKGGFNRCTLPRLTIKMGDKEAQVGDLEEKEMSEYEIEMEIRKMRKNHKIRSRRDGDASPEDEWGPPTKKKRVWNNFGTGRKRKKHQKLEAEEKLEEKMNLAMEQSADEVVCDNSMKGKEITAGQEGLLLQVNKNCFSTNDMTGIKPKVTDIIRKFEHFSKSQEKENLGTHISSGESSRKKFKGDKFFLQFVVGAEDGHSAGGGGIQTDYKAKPSSAKKPNKRKKFTNFNPSNYQPITNYFKPAIESDTTHTGEGGKLNLSKLKIPDQNQLSVDCCSIHIP